jgi:hypothetical protein
MSHDATYSNPAYTRSPYVTLINNRDLIADYNHYLSPGRLAIIEARRSLKALPPPPPPKAPPPPF